MIGDLEGLTISRSRITLKVTQPIALSEFIGSTLRGAFATTLLKIICAQRHLNSCGECYLKSSCAYAVLFSPRNPPDSKYFPGNERLPASFTLYIKENKKIYSTGEKFNLVLTLIGKAAEYFPYFFIVLQELGGQGFGLRNSDGNRGTFDIIEITDELAKEVRTKFGGKPVAALPPLQRVRLEELIKPVEDINLLKVHFATPLRVKWRGRLSSDIQFHILFRNVLRRLSALYFLAENKPLQLDYNSLIRQAEGVEMLQADLNWNDHVRYSSRQNQRMMMGGVTGWAVYKGDIAPFFCYLQAAELTAVGKGTTFGFGRIELEILEKGGDMVAL